MKKILYCVILTFLLGCTKSAENSLENCEELDLKSFQHPRMKSELFIPEDWYTALDINLSDTISFMVYDTSNLERSRSVAFFHYPSPNTEERNLEEIYSSLSSSEGITILSSGDLSVEELTVPYFLIQESTDQTINTLIIYIQRNDTALSMVLREIDENIDLKSFCWSSEMIYRNAVRR